MSLVTSLIRLEGEVVSEILLATRNEGKRKELVDILQELLIPVKVLSLTDFPDAPQVVEDGTTFYENAVKKAKEIMKFSGLLTLADDSGLEVYALGGAPGVFSSRFAGEGASDEANRLKLLKVMEGVPEEARGARFKCVVALAEPEGRVWTAEGVCEGKIGYGPRGEGGFGYDPLFILPQFGKTFAELPNEVKNRISHRAKAMKALFREYMKNL